VRVRLVERAAGARRVVVDRGEAVVRGAAAAESPADSAVALAAVSRAVTVPRSSAWVPLAGAAGSAGVSVLALGPLGSAPAGRDAAAPFAGALAEAACRS
jgi:hypothetical protein